jgi:hypothetical protein
LASVAFDDLLSPKLEEGDTCDRCGPGTIALVAFRLPSGRKLTFCNHHARVHAAALLGLDGVISSAPWPGTYTRKETA